MSSADVIDALFDRTVDVVQSLPKSGPIQTSYEEKLALYSLYKQATEGNVTSKRPGILDMLARAKWDAWTKRQGMDPLDAKQLYVESMMRTLRRFEDRREARALIQELENFSGDVAERVMRGALAADDTASEASSAPAPLRHQTQASFESAGDSDIEMDEDEFHAQEIGDRLTSLRNPAALTSSDRRRSTPARSTGGFSAQAQPPSVSGRERTRPGATTRAAAEASRPTDVAPQWDETTARSEEEESDDGTYSAGRSSQATSYLVREREEEEARLRALRAGGTSSTAMKQAAVGNRRQIAQQRQGGPNAPSSSHGAGSRVGQSSQQQQQQQQQQGIRTSASASGLYSSTGAGGRAIPAPPRSESNQGGGVGASLYSAVGPSARGAVEQHHHYHRISETGEGKAPASSTTSVRGGGGGGGGGAGQAEVEQALQSIQASLAALHERLNRVEVRGGIAKSGTSSTGSGGIYGSAYNAFRNALQDLGALFGLAASARSTRDEVRGKKATASFASTTSTDRNRNGNSGGSGSGNGNASPHSRLSSLLSFLVSLLNLSLRLALDLTSLGILITLFLFLLRKATGRGDPLLLLRMARRFLGRAKNATTNSNKIIAPTTTAAAAGRVVEGGSRKILEGGALLAGLGAAAGGAIREVAGSLGSTGGGESSQARQDGFGHRESRSKRRDNTLGRS